MLYFFRKKIAKIRNHFYPKEDIDSKIISLSPSGLPKGEVLISYIIEPFLLSKDSPIPNSHTHYWESLQIAKTFLDLGFNVDIISYRNFSFTPKKQYKYFISARTNLEHIAKQLPPNCIKVAHLDTAHWLTNNFNAYSRMLELEQRKKVSVLSARIIEINHAIEHADLATILGNKFTIDTYSYAKKQIYRIPISAPSTYPWDNNKNFDDCKKNFLWFGSSGFVHKGLDLVLDAFKALPDFNLFVFGPLQQEKEFVEAYHTELYETPNIKTIGWIDVDSKEFLEYAKTIAFLIYPTCAEGGGGSAITCMHAGIIPIVSHEASIDILQSGFILENSTIDCIIDTVRSVSKRPASDLKSIANTAWEYAQKNHTRANFAKEYRKFVESVLIKFKRV